MFANVLTIAKFTIIESMRNRLLWLSLLVLAISFGLVEFIGELAITEHRVTQVSILAALLRINAVIMIALFVVSTMLRELNDKTLEMIVAMPIARSSYYLGKLIGFIHLALIVTVCFSMLLLLYASGSQVLIWSISLLLELVLIVVLALVMIFTFRQMPIALTGVFVFYAASRAIASFHLMAMYPVIAHSSVSQKFIERFIEVLTWLLPDLHLFTQTEWLAYNTGRFEMLLPLLTQTLIYVILLSAIALFDFYRKNF